MNRIKRVILIVGLLLATALAFLLAVDEEPTEPEVVSADEIRVPSPLVPFIEDGMRPIALEAADLNLDGFEDYLLVLEPPIAEEDRPVSEARRPLLLLAGQADGSFRQVAHNERIILNALQGGALGDPFVGIQAEPGGFTVKHYGGSAWRWTQDFKFAYSRQDDAWLLVEVSEVSSNVHTDEETKKLSVPPTDFGKINLAEMDPENWESVGSGDVQSKATGNGLCLRWSSGDTVHLNACEVATQEDCIAGRPAVTEHDLVTEVAEGRLYSDAEGAFVEFRQTERTCHALAVEVARMAESSMSGQWSSWVYSGGLVAGDKAYLYGEVIALHARPDPASKVLNRYQGNTTAVSILDKAQGVPMDEMSSAWFKVKVGDVTGWVWGRYLHPDPASQKAFIH